MTAFMAGPTGGIPSIGACLRGGGSAVLSGTLVPVQTLCDDPPVIPNPQTSEGPMTTAGRLATEGEHFPSHKS